MEDRAAEPELTIVIPLHAEGRHFAETFQTIRAAAETEDVRIHFVLVDDGSPDNTWEVISTLARDNPAVTALRLSRNFGKEAALMAGLAFARGDAVITMDGDLQHPPTLIPEMVRIWLAGSARVVEAVKRERGGESLPRKMGAAAFTWLLHRLSGFDLRGATDFKLMDRKVLTALQEMPERVTFARGMIEWLGFPRERVYFDVPPREHGTSLWSTLALISLAVAAITSFTAAPLRIVTGIGLIFLAAAVLLGAWTLYYWLRGVAVEGFSTVIILQLTIGSATLISLGIIGEYIASLFQEIKGRPRFVVQECVGGSPGDKA